MLDERQYFVTKTKSLAKLLMGHTLYTTKYKYFYEVRILCMALSSLPFLYNLRTNYHVGLFDRLAGN